MYIGPKITNIQIKKLCLLSYILKKKVQYNIYLKSNNYKSF